MKLFADLIPATFLSRPNRFVVLCKAQGRTLRAYLPNPGRLWELLLPNACLLLFAAIPACSEILYDSLRHHQEIRCQELQGSSRTECLQRSSMSYDEYQRHLRERERQEER